MAGALPAATLCVNPGGTSGCYPTISAAVTAAAPGSTIQVAQGIYKESVVITQPLSLIGSNGYSIIDATGQSNGIFVNGMSTAPAAGVWGVVISGFTVKNANYEGILVANATEVTISGNTVDGNNRGLNYSASTCPGQPAYETNEGADCGEGIHLMAVDHSVIAGNTITNNAGGILVSDETGPNYENLITGNSVTDNALDCGITLASHAPAPNLPQGFSYGVFSNTISHNVVSHNGYIGQGAGVGIFAPGPGQANYRNVIADNILTDNGIGGVAMHNHAAPGVNGVSAHAPGVILADNQIIGNQISGNAADNDDPASPGPTGISILSFVMVPGTVIAQNTFSSEVADITFNAPAGTVAVHLNSFSGIEIGVAAESTGGIDASQNWWGCPTGPGGIGCSTITGSTVYAPSWLAAPLAAPVAP
jgi:parallel beta-helix repeat protein